MMKRTCEGQKLVCEISIFSYHVCHLSLSLSLFLSLSCSVDDGFDEHDIPYDVLWLDIEHTDGKR